MDRAGFKRLIGVAVGLLALRYGTGTDQAWERLVALSQHTNIETDHDLPGSEDGRVTTPLAAPLRSASTQASTCSSMTTAIFCCWPLTPM